MGEPRCAAKAIGYTGAGTVEFIAEQDGRFYFMEMNTRLQVEHPVTEMITGLDLVEWQLRVAAGRAAAAAQKEPSRRGHAIEARIYAEDPGARFPARDRTDRASGFPKEHGLIRIDTGVEAGDEITPWYDPMIAKLIVHGPDRAAALRRLRQALAEVEIAGVTTNVGFLRRLAREPGVRAGRARHRLDRAQPDRAASEQPVSRSCSRRPPSPSLPRKSAPRASAQRPPATRIRPGTRSTAGA